MWNNITPAKGISNQIPAGPNTERTDGQLAGRSITLAPPSSNNALSAKIAPNLQREEGKNLASRTFSHGASAGSQQDIEQQQQTTPSQTLRRIYQATGTAIHSRQIDDLTLRPPRRPKEDITEMVSTAGVFTQDSFESLITQDPRALKFSMCTSFSSSNNTLTISRSYRKLRDGEEQDIPHASDAYLAQLAKHSEYSTGREGLPTSLPSNIVRETVVNIGDEYSEDFFLSLHSQFPHTDEIVNLRVDRDQLGSRANEAIYRVLTETVQGKSTVSTVNDFNALQNTNHSIEGIDIRKNGSNVDVNFKISRIV